MKPIRTCARLAAMAAVLHVAFSYAQEAPVERTIESETALLSTKGRLRAQQKALARLAVNPDPGAEKLLLTQFERLNEGTLPGALWLDLIEAAEKRNTPAMKDALTAYRAKVDQSRDPLVKFGDALEGGDGELGAKVFHRIPEPGCARCHMVDAKGGEIGPDLTWLRNSVQRSNILESIVLPNATMAIGFQSALFKLKSGEEVTGVVTFENASDLTLTSVADGKKRRIEIDSIEKRTPLPTPMPPHFGATMSKRDLRDLIEFLAAGE